MKEYFPTIAYLLGCLFALWAVCLAFAYLTGKLFILILPAGVTALMGIIAFGGLCAWLVIRSERDQGDNHAPD